MCTKCRLHQSWWPEVAKWKNNAGVSLEKVHQLLNPYTQNYLWLEEAFELTSDAQIRCWWMPKTAEPPERLLWFEATTSSLEDEWFIAFLLSLATTKFLVRL
jgi:hypothetical protein